MKAFKVWNLISIVACTLFILPGCEEVSSLDESQAAQESTAMSWRDLYLQLGKDTYQDACAVCHDKGDEGAPMIGDRVAWSSRSTLWSAVLIEHAKNGHLGMPAKGGCSALSERQVAAAGEYMLSETFPELPRD
jgi:cytochrome c5